MSAAHEDIALAKIKADSVAGNDRRSLLGGFLLGLAVVVIILALIGWGVFTVQQNNETHREKIRICNTIEGAAERTLCVQGA